MKHLHVFRFRRLPEAAVILAVLLSTSVSRADSFTTGVKQQYSMSPRSWNSAIWQPGSLSPGAGNDYEVLKGGLLCAPAARDTQTFPGDSLTLDEGSRLRITAWFATTLNFPGVNGNPGLILNGGRLQAAPGGVGGTYTIAGQVSVVADSIIDNGWAFRGFAITAQITGNGTLTLINGSDRDPVDIQSAGNLFSGDWVVQGGYLKGTGVGSLGTGNILVGNGALFEVNYDIQTPGTLTLLGGNSVMVLHQNCQFSAVTINGTALPPGNYSYADLAAQFPGNFADGGSGSITIALLAQNDAQASVAPPATNNTQSNLPSVISNDTSAIVADVPTIIDSIIAPVAPLIDPLIDTVAPAVSSGVTAMVGSSSQITVSWNPTTDSGGSGLAGYRIYRGGLLLGTTTGTSYTDSGLTAGSQYCYTIVGYDNTGNNSSASAQTCATTLGPLAPPVATVFNEWYGPFASWTNVMAFGAKCDGVTDDSVAVSNALAVIGTGHCSPVLLIPGMCRVTKKPWLSQRRNIAVVGLNQNTCGFLYDGPTVAATYANNSGAATCFHVDGVVNCYFARLKFDGNFKARTVLASSQQSFNIFDNNNLYEDCIIKNAAPGGGQGLDGGHFEPWEGFSNEDFVRCSFQTNSIGAEMDNFNALDIWFTDCLFEGNTTYGIYISEGSAHAYHSFFQHNGIDFYNGSAAPFNSLVSNTSYQSTMFFSARNGVGANTTPTLFKGNTVIDPAQVPYQFGQYGPVFFFDNTTLTTNATIAFSSGSLADFLAVGNTNGVANWALYSNGTSSIRSNLVDNYVVTRAALTFQLPARPVAATNLNRTLLEMGVGVTAASLQNAINSAGDGSVFHIPSNVSDQYHQTYLNGAITIPANKDVRIVGDGADTILFWQGPSGGTFFSCPYPSHATFSHLSLIGNYGGAANLISVSGVGNTPARVYLRDSGGSEPVGANIFMGNCPNTVIDVAGLSYGGGNTPSTPATTGGNIVLSGAGKVRFINADGGQDYVAFTCTNGGQLYVENSYHEAENSTVNRLLQLSGNGTVTFLGSKMVEDTGAQEDFSQATGNGFSLANFTGQLTLMGIQVVDYLNLSGSTTGLVWVEGANTFRNPGSAWPINNSTGDSVVQTMNYNYSDSAGGTVRLPDTGTASAAFTRHMLTQARTEYTDRTPMARRTNQTDVLLEQVFFSLGTQNLGVTP
jgi:hypothetical protein